MIAWLALAMLPPWGVRAEQGASEREQLIRGALLYKFAKFVAWPGDLGEPTDPLVICVFGDQAFAALIHRKVRDLTVQGHPVVARGIAELTESRACHVVYYAQAEGLAAALEAVEGHAVLTVGSHDDFLRLGGIINLVRNEDTIGFEISLAASKKAQLDLSSRLLDVALRVEKP